MNSTREIRILVCDDDVKRAKDWSHRIAARGSHLDVTPLGGNEFGRAVGALKARKETAKRVDDPTTTGDDAARVFDDVDILFIDTDLTPDPDTHFDEDRKAVDEHLVGQTGGEVAHLARCYSSAGPIVVVNQKWRSRAFDLTMVGLADEVGDVYISEEDIDNPGLWSPDEPPSNGFRPWHWPHLQALPQQVAELLESVSEETSITDLLGLTDGDLTRLTGRQLDALGIEDLSGDTRIIDIACRSSYGLRLKENASTEQQLRLSVYGLRRWLDREVVNAQNVLVDFPHLLVRQPWRVEQRDDLDVWNDSQPWWDLDSASPRPPILGKASRLLGRPVWRWADLSADSPNGPRFLPDDPVFCEDTSRFVEPHAARDFFSDLDGQWAQRYVAEVAAVDYHPRRRLLA